MEKYDSALLYILQNEGKVAPFLDAILGFLYRRTDFFRTMRTERDKLGFPPGVAKKLLVNIFSKYEVQAQKDATKLEEMKIAKEREMEREKKTELSEQGSSTDLSSEQVEANISESKQDLKAEEAKSSTIQQNTSQDERGKVENLHPADDKDCAMDTESQTDEKLQDHKDTKELLKETEDGDEKEDPEQARQRRLLQENPLTYNGAERDNYFWSQTIIEADLRVKIPTAIVKGKQVKVTISKKHIVVSHQTEDGSWSKVVDNSLLWEVNPEESMWTLTPREFVHINLEKKEERWWECVFVDEPKINTRKIDCSRPMTDLDDEAQAKIQEMMYNQRQKQLGLPQSHEQKTHDMLRKAWDAEGSPFKGQPFDPSKFNVDPNGVINMNQS